MSRKLTLRIDAKEHIPVLSIPKYCSRKRAVAFVNENMDWIINSLGKLPQMKQFTAGDSFLLFGQKVTIRHNADARRGVWLDNDVLNVSGSAEFLHRRVRDYIKQRAADELRTELPRRDPDGNPR